MIVARAVGLDVGAMSDFNAVVDEEFFAVRPSVELPLQTSAMRMKRRCSKSFLVLNSIRCAALSEKRSPTWL